MPDSLPVSVRDGCAPAEPGAGDAFVETLLDTVGALVIVLDTQGRIVRFNKACEQLTGYSFAEVAGRVFWDFLLLPADQTLIRDGFQKLTAGRFPSRRENPWLTRDGRAPLISWSNTALLDDRGAITHVIGTGLDITQQRQAELALREAHQFNQQVIASAGEGIVVYDRDLRYVLFNPFMEEMTGLPAKAVLGKHPWDVFPFLREQGIDQVMHRALAGETVTASDIQARNPTTGEFAWADSRFAPLRDATGDIIGVLGTISDITDRRLAEEERRRLDARVQQAQKLQSLGVMAGGIAHDFNNLLMAILGYTSLAQRELPAGSAATPLLAEVDKAAHRAADLARQMLAYAGRGTFVVQPFALDALVREMAKLLSAVVSSRASLQLRLLPAAIEGDATQIRQVVMNLITNAADATEATGGFIEIRTGLRDLRAGEVEALYLEEPLAPGEYAFLEVRDTGCGMDVDTLARIFDPFFTTKFTGRGLGLASVLGILRGHRGAIRVRSELGHGACFEVFLPARMEPLPACEPAPASTKPAGGVILLVEDDPTLRTLGRRILEVSGFTVRDAADGVAGVEAFSCDPDGVDVVLLDLTMPRMGGLEAMQRMRAIRADIPVVLVSGFSEQEMLDRGGATRRLAALQKPYRAEELLAAIDRVRRS